MRLLVVSNMYPGPRKPNFGIFVSDRVGAYRRLGADVAVVANSDPRTGRWAILKYLSLSLRAVWRAWRFRPHLVEGHYLWPTGAVAAVAAAVARAPYVLYAHGSDVPDGSAPSPVRRVVGRAAEIHTNSADTAARIRRAFGEDTAVRVLPPGVDLTVFEPRGEPDPRLVGFVGDLVAHKGVDVALRALADMSETVRLLVVGDGPERASLEGLAGELGVAGRVVWRGAVEHAELPGLFSQMAVVVVPSRRDALGLVAVEALACGRPVVVSAVGGLASLPSPDCGESVPAGDPAALAEAAERWLARAGDPEIARAARRRAETFALDDTATRALTRLEEVVKVVRRTSS